jgi:16S rRNA (guanine527-N7)-methyltransferase
VRTPEQDAMLKKYADAVIQAPPHLHLTSSHDVHLFWNRHVADAVQIHENIPSLYKAASRKLIDIGSGNGIPGIPFSILEPTWQVDLLDSDNKKALFIDTFISSNAISNARMIIDRAEIRAHGELRGAYDIVLARALSKLRVSLELCAGFIKVGGVLIVPHGTSWKSELGEDLSILGTLGYDKPIAVPYQVDSIEFVLLAFPKVAETPAKYPRRNGVPKKKPL